ncbi:hypothetical protein AAGF08_15990 [Algoriphagus sp. SE2]|uniref:hypothetical protein n=1 Tax=Algoriphagus sp. SE2 TaxID=3141536 RepID=UPI0031CD83C5
MKQFKWKFSFPQLSLILALFGGLLFSACSTVEDEPDTSDLTNVVTDKALSKLNPNLLQLEGTFLEASAEGEATNAQSRGIPSDRVRFNIDLKFVVEPTERQREVFESAVERWERIIIKDEADLTGVTIPSFYPGQPDVVPSEGVLDDLVIEVNLREIDGPGRILGRAGPTWIRAEFESTEGFTSLAGIMEFDVADLDRLEEQGQFENVILHEMGHVLGIGTLWRLGDFGFDVENLINLSTIEQIFNPDYLGNRGNLFWKTEGGEGLLPVEGVFFRPDGTPFIRQGTSFGHWDEDALFNELMTGFLNGGVDNPLSRITAGSVRDLGYGAATVGERYELPTPSEAARTRNSEDGINIAESEELFTPIGVVFGKKK